MGKDRDLNLHSFDISDNRYRELKYFCRQYREKQSQLRSVTEISSPRFNGVGRGNKTADKTADIALIRMQLERDIEMIEQSAIEVGGEISQYIISNVSDGIAYEYLQVPAGRRQFYELRKMFFSILSAKKGN